MNSRYGYPYYTLSRGAPSASWVLLQIRVALFYSIVWISTQLFKYLTFLYQISICLHILTQISHLVKCFLLFSSHDLFSRSFVCPKIKIGETVTKMFFANYCSTTPTQPSYCGFTAFRKIFCVPIRQPRIKTSYG